MASLLHVDHRGASLAGALIERSGLTPTAWLRQYLRAYYTPLLHSFYAYDLVFMPHGENVILVLRDGAVQRAIYKDIAEEIAVMDPDAALPPEVRRIRVEVPEETKLLSIFTDVFDCFFRFLAAHLAAEGVLTEDDFGARSPRSPASTRRRTPSWPTSSASTTCSPPSSRCPASTGSSCATTSRWWTSPTRPARSSWSAPFRTRSPGSDGPEGRTDLTGTPEYGPPGCPSACGQRAGQGTCGDR